MSKKDLDRIKRQRTRAQIEEEKQRFLASLPKEKRLELERQMEIDVPPFMRDREQRIKKAKRSGKVSPKHWPTPKGRLDFDSSAG